MFLITEILLHVVNAVPEPVAMLSFMLILLISLNLVLKRTCVVNFEAFPTCKAAIQ